MSTSGIILIIFMFVMFTILFCFKNKLSFEKKSSRIILDVFAGLCFIYFIAARWAWNIKDCCQYINGTNSYLRDIYLSKSLLLDLCPMMAFILPLFIIFGGKKKTWARCIAPVAIIGSGVTIFGACIFEDIPPQIFLEYFFIGIKPNRMYFMMHFLSAFLAVWVIMCGSRYTFKDGIRTFMFYCVWIMYCVVCMSLLKIEWNVTGLVANDWLSTMGEYHKVYLIWSLPFPFITIFWYTIALLVNAFICICKNISLKKAQLKSFKNKPFVNNNKTPMNFVKNEDIVESYEVINN